MNRLRETCPDCPMRAKVDPDRAGERTVWGSQGIRVEMFDGSNRHDVKVTTDEVNDSRDVQAILKTFEDKIEECEGPEIGAVRKRCAADLGSSWRWSDVEARFKPNVSSAADIIPLIDKGGYEDAFPYRTGNTYHFGTPSQHSELDCPSGSAFVNMGIGKLTQKVTGETAELRKGQAVMVDAPASWTDKTELAGYYRVRIAQGGPEFLFQPSAFALEYRDESRQERTNRLLAEGIYAFVSSTVDEIQESDALIARADFLADEHYEEVRTLLFDPNSAYQQMLRRMG